LPKFVLSLGFLGTVLTVAVSFFSYQNSKAYLEEMYAQRVIFGSRSIADSIPLEDVEAIVSGSGPGSEAYERTAALLNTLKEDGEITFLSMTVPDEDSVTFYIDACVPAMGDDPANQIPYGSDILYVDTAGDEADLQKYLTGWELYAQNRGTDTPLVTDNDYGYNFTSVSPILNEEGQAIAEIQYILDMRQVRSYLNSFLMTMLAISLAIIAVALVCYILFVRLVVTAPIGKLAGFTHALTASGEFSGRRIEINTGDEIQALGESFNYMLEELERYIENLSRITAEKERIGAELSVATHIQASMLPCIFPAFPDRQEFDVYATMDPAKEVGGDFYDFFLVDQDHLAVVVADVSGKGVPAALFMVIAKTLIKDHAQTGAAAQDVFTEVNRQLCESNEEGLFVTAWMGVLELSTGTLTFVNAGHNPPLVGHAGGAYEYLRSRPGFVLAGMEGTRYRPGSLTLAPGDTLYLYTDGVTEATDAHERLYGEERLKEALDRMGGAQPQTLLPAIKADVDAFVGDAPQFDDITMLALRYRGSSFS